MRPQDQQLRSSGAQQCTHRSQAVGVARGGQNDLRKVGRGRKGGREKGMEGEREREKRERERERERDESTCTWTCSFGYMYMYIHCTQDHLCYWFFRRISDIQVFHFFFLCVHIVCTFEILGRGINLSGRKSIGFPHSKSTSVHVHLCTCVCVQYVTNHNFVEHVLEVEELDAETGSSCSAGERHCERTVATWKCGHTCNFSEVTTMYVIL